MAVFDETGPGAPPPGTPIPEITQADRDFTARYPPIQKYLALPGVPGMPQSLSELVPGGAVPNAITRYNTQPGRFGLPASSMPVKPVPPPGPLSPVTSSPPLADAAANSTPPTAADVEEARRRAAAYFALGSNAQNSSLSGALSSAFTAPQPTPQPQQSLMPRPLPNTPIYRRLG